MKTIAKTLIAISLLMIALQVSAAGTIPYYSGVHYKVQVHLSNNVPFYTRNVFVVLTDENNRMIDAPQLLRCGKTSYDFREMYTVTGTRVAKLIYTDGNTTELFHSAPDSQTGRFATGVTYPFNLYVSFPKAGKGGVD